METKSPDWGYWSKLPEVRVFEAIALLDGRSPGESPPEGDDADERYRKRLRSLVTAMYDRAQFSPAALSMESPALHDVKLAEVGSWAIAQGFSIPDAFPRKPATPTVKWPLWLNMPQVALWEAVALVLNIEPTTMRQSPDAWMAGPGLGPIFIPNSFPSREKEGQFEEAMLLATRAANFSGPIHLRTGLAAGMNKKMAMVALGEVTSFFESCQWADIPAQLLKQAPTSEPMPEEGSPAASKPAAPAQPPVIDFDEVMYQLEGEERHVREYQQEDGTRTVETHSFGPDRWIERVHERQILSAIEFVSLVLFAVEDLGETTREEARRLVDDWATELRKAAEAREFSPRDVTTLLPVPSVPAGWSWGLSMDDADAFLASRGMKWKCSEVAVHVYKQCERRIHALRFPPELFGERDWGDKPQPAPVQSFGKRWTPEAKAELAAYKATHGTKKAAAHYRISEARVRELCPTEKPAPRGYSAFNSNPK